MVHMHLDAAAHMGEPLLSLWVPKGHHEKKELAFYETAEITDARDECFREDGLEQIHETLGKNLVGLVLRLRHRALDVVPAPARTGGLRPNVTGRPPVAGRCRPACSLGLRPSRDVATSWWPPFTCPTQPRSSARYQITLPQQLWWFC